MKGITQQDVKDFVNEMYPDDEVLLFESPDYASAFLGITDMGMGGGDPSRV